MIKRFVDWYKNRHAYQKEWKKKTNGKIIGFFCTYTPEEILYAHNILPVRILGDHNPSSTTNPHIFEMFCSFCKDILEEVLKGKNDHLDGIISAQSCLHLRQAYTSSDIHKRFLWSHYLCMPNFVQSNRSVDFLVGEYELLIKKLRDFTSLTITDSDLEKSIVLLNQVRRTLREIFFLRSRLFPLVKGSDFMYVACSNFFVDARTWLEEAIRYKKALEAQKYVLKRDFSSKRIMLIGIEDGNIDLIRAIEKFGAVVVAEDSCNSVRYFWDDVKEGTYDPLVAIAQRYTSKIPCPSKDWPIRNRIKKILKWIDELKIDGVIITRQIKCHPHGVDVPFLLRAIGEEKKCPVFVLEYDLTDNRGYFEEEIEEFIKNL